MKIKPIIYVITLCLILSITPTLSSVGNEVVFYENNDQTHLILNNDQNQQDQITFSNSEDLTPIITQVTQSLVYGYTAALVGFGPRVTGTTACNNAGNYIANTFESFGLEVMTQDFGDGFNVEGTLPGTDQSSDEIYLVCGHYDSVHGSPGADDNAGGVSSVMASAQILSQYSFAHTLKFVAFSGEEQGLHGSSYYANQAYDNGDNIVRVLNADMIGYTDTQTGMDNVHFKGSGLIAYHAQQISDQYDELIELTIVPGSAQANSDHWPFMQNGYDAGMFHEYEFNPYYHSPQDTMDKMDFNYLMRVSRVITGSLAEYADFIPPSQGGKGYLPLLIDVEYPVMNDVVNGTITIRGNSYHPESNAELKFVAVQIDDQPWDEAEGTVNWSYTLDTSTLADGEHLISALCSDGVLQSGVEYVSIIVDNHNYPPETPELSTDIISGLTGHQYQFRVQTTDMDEDMVTYGFDWNGDNVVDEWTAFHQSGELLTVDHTWDFGKQGVYNVQVMAEDENGQSSGFSPAVVIQINQSDFDSPSLSIVNPARFIYVDEEELMPFFLPVIIGDVQIEMQASDSLSGIDIIEVYIDGSIVHSFTGDDESYSFMWDEQRFGVFTLQVQAFDKEGNSNTQELKILNIK